MDELHVARLTPDGRGGIATLAITGRGVTRCVARFFRPRSGRPLETMERDRPLVGTFFFDAEQRRAGEDMVVYLRSDCSAELHCHGGPAVVRRVEQTLATAGARVQAWRDWVENIAGDAIRAAAVRALAEATTSRAAAHLLAQYNGALRAELEEAIRLLRRGEGHAAGPVLERLLGRARLGRHLVAPWKIVVAGPPNAGKSSLVNALVGYERAIVHHEPGTTRDLVTARTAIEGWPVLLIDTAGLRETYEPVERAGVELAREALRSADLVLRIFDATADPDLASWNEPRRSLRAIDSDAIMVFNKMDLVEEASRPPEMPEALNISARTGAGLDMLLATVAGRLVPDPPEVGHAIPFTEAQSGTIRQATELSEAGRWDEAADVLTGLLFSKTQ